MCLENKPDCAIPQLKHSLTSPLCIKSKLTIACKAMLDLTRTTLCNLTSGTFSLVTMLQLPLNISNFFLSLQSSLSQRPNSDDPLKLVFFHSTFYHVSLFFTIP